MNWHQLMEKAFAELKARGAAAAEPYLLQAMEQVGEQAEFRAITIFNLGLCYYDLRRPKEAENCFAQAIEIVQELLPKQNELYGMFLKTMIEFYEKENRLPESKRYFLLEIDHTATMYGAKHPYVANIICEYSEILIRANEYADAEKRLCRALEIMSSARGPDHQQNAAIHKNLAVCYEAMSRQEDAMYHRSRFEILQTRGKNLKNSGGPQAIDEQDATLVDQPMD
ncbi:MAG: tetratricopeptide repeat protein [Candidatus Obscuribacterales bacterium]|nr:tetratricopeptide repeat protein [Candidatus Obscuribacterales bacterium]